MKNREDFLFRLTSLAFEAGEKTLAYFGNKPSSEEKEDGSPVTAADLAAHAFLSETLASLEPLPILSEEGPAIKEEIRRDWKRFWLVDPLDGTKEFLSGSPEFTVNVALVEEGIPTLGVVVAPALGRAWAAAQGIGAFAREKEGAWRRIAVSDSLPVPARVVVSRSHESWQKAEEKLAQVLPVVLTPAGSSLKFCKVAEGLADVYPRRGPTMEWDTGAGECVARVAGAVVSTWDGSPMRYNKPKLTNPPFWVATPSAVQSGVVQRLQEALGD